MEKRMLLLVNPNAGKGSFRSCLGQVMEIFCAAHFIPTVFFTRGRQDATRIVATEGGKYDLVVCLGGDGTLSEVVAGLMAIPDAPPLGYIPMGTANDVATTLSLPRSPEKAARTIVNGRASALDVGSFGDDSFFTYIAAFGAFTAVSYETSQETKQALGHMAYILSGVASVPKIAPHFARVEYDGGMIEDEFIFGGVTNSTSIAGLVKLDEALVSLSDGLFELILVRHPKNLVDMNKIVGDIVWRNYEGGQVTVLHTKRARFIMDEPVAWTRDGESGGQFKEIVLENRRAALNIIV